MVLDKTYFLFFLLIMSSLGQTLINQNYKFCLQKYEILYYQPNGVHFIYYIRIMDFESNEERVGI